MSELLGPGICDGCGKQVEQLIECGQQGDPAQGIAGIAGFCACANCAPGAWPAEPWPTDEGIWIGYVDGVGWMPFQTMFLRDDLPTQQDMAEEKRTGVKWIGKPLAVVAQLPERDGSWPYLFKGSHPVSRWRRPDADELRRAQVLYGTTPKQ